MKRHIQAQRNMQRNNLIPKSEIRNPKTISRQGSVLIVVIGLLLLLMLLGLTFFTFSNQEYSSAQYYAEAGKVYSGGTVNSDSLFDFGLEQLIIGPHDNNQQSVLWPGRHALIPNMVGMFAPSGGWNNSLSSGATVPTDRHLYNGGSGIIVGSDANGAPVFLSNTQYPTLNYSYINLSPAALVPAMGAKNVNLPTLRQQIYNTFPAPDVGYTYPDINNVFLSYSGVEPTSGQTVSIPSFHRPQYLRWPTNGANPGQPITNWYDPQGVGPDTTALVMRPHRNHVSVASLTTKVTYQRFLGTAVPAPTGNRYIQPFPFAVDANANGTFGEQGVFFNRLPQTGLNPGTNLDYDADNDGDGIPEGVWLDLNYPVIALGDGRRAVPLVSFTVQETDSLINLNVAGNLAGFSIPAAVGPLTGANIPNNPKSYATPFSRSNFGVSPSEINPFWALIADPNSTTYLPTPNSAAYPAPELQQHQAFLVDSRLLGPQFLQQYLFSRTELANVEMAFLLWGRPRYEINFNDGQGFPIPTDVVGGLWGEGNAFMFALQNKLGVGFYPRPGLSGFDDDGDALAGTADAFDLSGFEWPSQWPASQSNPIQPVVTSVNPWPNNYGVPLFPAAFFEAYATATAYPALINPSNGAVQYPAGYYYSNSNNQFQWTVPPFSQPLDYTGLGQWTKYGANGMVPALVSGFGAPNPAYYLQYTGFQSGLGSIPYTTAFNQNLVPAVIPPLTTPNGTLTLQAINANPIVPPTYGIMDEPDEVVVDDRFKTQNDQPFTRDELAGLHLSPADYQTNQVQSRLRQLLSFNFEANLQAAAIRKHFTTESWDRRQHGFAFENDPANTYNQRSWEFGVGATATIGSNWDGSQITQFPPMVLPNPNSKPNPTYPVASGYKAGYSMDGLVPAQVDTPNSANPNSTTAAEPFRVELAALIGSMPDNSNLFNQYYYGPKPNVNAYSPYPFSSAPYAATNKNRSTNLLAVSPWQQQLRLNINRFLTVADPTQPFGNPSQPLLLSGTSVLPPLTTPPQPVGPSVLNPLRYRELTPHPTNSQWTNSSYGSAAINIASSPPRSFVTDAQSFSTRPDLQEYWARRDRQQMARDLYVMLYMLGGGDDTMNYTSPNSGGQLYKNWQLYEMAQFAVNVVDSLDRDDTITPFEFDMDLSDGWNLDDDPFTTTGDTGPAGLRGVVYGVEAQELAFSEALVVASLRVPQTSDSTKYLDHFGTLFDDSKRDRTFTYLELYNMSPHAVAVNQQNWQIMLLDPKNLPATAGPTSVQPANAVSILTFNDSVTQSVQPGTPYTIASRTYIAGATNENLAASGNPHGSALVVDLSWDPAANSTSNPNFQNLSDQQLSKYDIIPAGGLSMINLDLVGWQATGAKSQPFILTQNNSVSADTTIGDFCDLTLAGPNGPLTAGSYVYDTNGDASKGRWGSSTPVSTFALRRRLNLQRPAPQILTSGTYAKDDLDNPYVQVDQITYSNTVLAPGASTPTPSANGGQFLSPVDPSKLTKAQVQADLTPRLQALVSHERKQPLDGDEGSSVTWLAPPQIAATTPVGLYNTLSTTSGSKGTKSRVPYYYDSTNVPIMPNTFGTTNWSTTSTTSPIPSPPGYFNLWQPHFDRDFTSVMDLLSVPIYSPDFVTRCLAQQLTGTAAMNALVSEFPQAPAAGSPYMPVVAQAKFLRPQHPSNVGTNPSTNPYLDNRWYRVLELMEVPPRSNMQAENTLLTQYWWLSPQALQRTPGKINLNGLRFSENLFALLDDPGQFDFARQFGYTNNQLSTGTYADQLENARDWWLQTIRARDGYDPQTQLYLPGTGVSRPYRAFSFHQSLPNYNPNPVNNQFPAIPSPNTINPYSTPIDDTVLRSHQYDYYSNPPAPATPAGPTADAPTTMDRRGLFEARSHGDLASVNPSTGNSVDYYTRQRLLAKVANNSTQRSNVFLVWMTVGFFEGYQPDPINNPGIVQVGAEMTDQTRRRGFFVIDRSLLEDAWVPLQFDINNNPVAGTGTYDYSKFIQYRKTLQ